MPAFSVAAYVAFLEQLIQQGTTLLPVTQMANEKAGKKTVFLRHDVDFSLQLSLPMAIAEAERGITATYYILLNGPYSLEDNDEGDSLKHLVELKHEIGLHYDLKNYPDDPQNQQKQLLGEVNELESLIGKSINTITMHEPHRTAGDPFRQGQWIHPHNPKLFSTVRYVSDSCRAWRDESLLDTLTLEKDRLLLLTHPELWLDEQLQDRYQYLKEALIPHMTEESLPYFREEVPAIWNNHMGVWLHDHREALRKAQCSTQWLTKQWVSAQLNRIIPLFHSTPSLPWGEKEILMDVPEKWAVSAGLFEKEELIAASFNSAKEGFLYIHAIVVSKARRGEGLGQLLLKELQLRARADFKGIRLRVHDTNTDAIKWYKKHGFRFVAHEENEEQSVMEWTLS